MDRSSTSPLARVQGVREAAPRIRAVLWLGFIALAVTSCSPAETTAQGGPADPTLTVRASGSGTAMPLAERLADAYELDHPEIDVQFDEGTNSGGAIDAVNERSLDLAVVNRPLEQDEAAMGLQYEPVARDVVTFAVNLPNPVTGLTSDQLRAVYSGRVTEWSEIGGDPGHVFVLDRDPDESARKLVLDPLMAGEPVLGDAIVLAKASEMLDALAGTPASVGYTSLGLLSTDGSAGVRVLELDGVTPSAAAVADGTYPWYLTLGLVVGPDAPPALREFLAWAGGPQSQIVREQFGYAKASS